MPDGSKESFLKSLRAFALDHGLQYKIRQIHPVDKTFAIDIWNAEFAIAGENSQDRQLFTLDLYVDLSNAVGVRKVEDIRLALVVASTQIDGVSLIEKR